MGEGLDCMEEIKKSRCTVDVREFEMKWYWQVKRQNLCIKVMMQDH